MTLGTIAILGQNKKKQILANFGFDIDSLEAEGFDTLSSKTELTIIFRKEPPTAEDLKNLKLRGFEQSIYDSKFWTLKKP